MNELTVVESFKVSPEPGRNVDILFVVDNSASMKAEQLKLGSRLQSFVDSIDSVSWRIGVTTTDVSDGPFGLKGDLLRIAGTSSYYLSKDDPNAAENFLNTVVRRETGECEENPTIANCPSGREQPIQAMLLAMQKKNNQNRGFFREGSDPADFVAIVLTDEDEYINQTGNLHPREIASYMKRYLPSAKSHTVFGIYIDERDDDCLESQKAHTAVVARYVGAVVEFSGGTFGSICADDYGPTLRRIGESVDQPPAFVELKDVPEESTVKVSVEPNTENLTWKIVGRKIQFNRAFKKPTNIKVTYLPKEVLEEIESK